MKLLIADDELLIRRGLSTALDWESLGFDTIYTAEDGLESLAVVELTPPDLVLTDIRMPFLNGLELVEKLQEASPDICTIIISGHDEFSYAKAALKFNVFDYLLKPINLEELGETVKKAVLFINERKRRAENAYYSHIFNKPISEYGPDYLLNLATEEAPEDLAECDVHSFVDSLTAGNRKDSLREFNAVKENFLQKERCSRIILQLVCSNLFFACKHAIEEQGGQLEAIFDCPEEVFSTLVNQPSISGMFDYLTDIIKELLEYRSVLLENTFSNDIENAKKFIQQNYANTKLSLNHVAEHINVSPCYFSVIFKKSTDITFINYLTKVRIDKAKELLSNSSLKSYEISDKVGYDNSTYFCTLFKKLTGQSPLDYKKTNVK